jgi:GT2 family glycosyltransferase
LVTVVPLRLFVTSAGNETMLDIAQMVSDGLSANGVDHDLAIDELPTRSSAALQLVVAPHEFIPLFAALRTTPADLVACLNVVYMLNVEQPGSQWFEISWEHCRRSRGVFDISPAGVREFRRRGIPARLAPLGYTARLESATQLPHPERAIDVLFLGHDSRRREEFFSRHAELFSRYRCHIGLLDAATGRGVETPGYFAGQARRDLLARSRILLNVHSAERSYFETHRALLGLANGCLLVTEVSRDTEPLVNGEHFVMGALEELPAICARYLENGPQSEAIASRGAELARSAWHARETCRPVITVLEQYLRGEGPGGASSSPTEVAAEDARLRRAVIERMAESRRRASRGDVGRSTVSNAAYLASADPSVTVVVTSFNYERYIEPCLTSAFRCDGVPGGYEVLVVDDASTDDSAAIVERIMAEVDVPVLLVRKALNTGLADARNVGLHMARAPYVFVLDADNLVYPSCLRTLYDAITAGPYAGAYSMIRKFDDETDEALGLLSTGDWSVEALVRGPYIDAMAMLDRAKIQQVGGYSTELIEHGWFGWEDYDLWLKLAQAGYRCRLVPQILSAYRVHPASMLQRTNRTADGLCRHLAGKFQGLIDRHPGLDRRLGVPVGVPRPLVSRVPDSDIQSLQQRCLALTDELAAVYSSKSWRVTAPLRWLLGLVIRA